MSERRRVAYSCDQAGIEEGNGRTGCVCEALTVGRKIVLNLSRRIERRKIGDRGRGRIDVGGSGGEQRTTGTAHAIWRLLDGVVDAAERAAALGPEQVRVREKKVVAPDLDIKVVFEGKSDGVMQR